MTTSPAPFTCRHCGACCGPAPCSAAELDQVVQWAAAHDVVPRAQGLDCPFLALATPTESAACRVYPVRPSVCRLMGQLPGLGCRFHGDRGTLSARAARRARKELRRSRPVTTLHSLVYSDAELGALLRGDPDVRTQRTITEAAPRPGQAAAVD